MSRDKQKKPKCEPYESTGKYLARGNQVKNDTFATLWESMARSDAYKDLNSKQKVLYTHCKLQIMGKKKPGQDFSELNLFQGKEYFYLNFNEVYEVYGLYTKSMSSDFYHDMKTLAEHGFIKQVSKGGGNGHRKSIYMLISDWQTWNKENPYTDNWLDANKKKTKRG